MMIGLIWICIVCFALDEVNANTDDQIDARISPCAVKWMEVHDVYSLGAKFQFKIRSVDECREFCIKRLTGCVAIDVHGNFTNCFTHTQSLDKLEKTRRPQKGYTQLILIEECASSTPTPTTKINESTLQSFTKTDEDIHENFTSDTPEPSSSTLAPTTGTDEISSTVSIGISGESISLPATETDCFGLFDEWEEYKDTYTLKGKLYPKVPDSEACKRACVEEIAGCVAVLYRVPTFCSYIDEAIDLGEDRMSRKGFVLYVRRDGCKNAKSVQLNPLG